MAKFKEGNVELRDNQKLIFDSAKNKYMSHDGSELFVTTNISGVTPIEDYHLGTKLYVDDAIATATGSLTQDHSGLNELDYASAGHTGFQPAGSYVTDSEMTTISGDLVAGYTAADVVVTNAYIAADVVLDSKIDTTSGTLQTDIDTKSDTGHTHTESDIKDLGDYATNAELTTASGDIVSQIPTDFYTQSEVDTISGSLDAAKEDAFSKNTAFNKDFGITNITVASGSHTHAGGSTVFGSEYDYAESESESSTTSNTYQQKLRLTTGTVVAGTYRIGWSFEYTSTTDKVDCGFKVELDDTTILNEVNPPPQKKYADGSYYDTAGFKHISLTNTSHTIDLDYLANVAAEEGTTYIKRARLEIWRVE